MLDKKEACKYLEGVCAALDKNEQYQKFKIYKDKVLALGNDSLEKTIAIAVALCLVCAVLVSFAAVALKPLQVNNKAADMKKNILDVAGLLEEGANIDTAFAEKIEAKIVDLETGDYVENINANEFDQRKAAKDYGLWSTLYGFLSVEADGQTVQSINFYDQAETPGLGGEVVNPNWRALWKGKKVYAESDQPSSEKGLITEADIGEPALSLIKGVVDNSKPGAQYQVDGLAGATLTSTGVTNLVRYWMSNEGFAPYLKKVRTAKRG